jgi:hypothetical protein
MQYQVLSNHNRHIVIVVNQTPKLTHYLAINATGVCNYKMPTPAFKKEYDISTKYSPIEAALKFLSSAARGYLFNEKAVIYLKEIIMKDNDVVNEQKDLITQASEPSDKQKAMADKKAAAAAKIKESKPVKESKPRGQGIGAFCEEMSRTVASNAEILAAVKEKWPNSNTSLAGIAWYRKNALKGAVNGND